MSKASSTRRRGLWLAAVVVSLVLGACGQDDAEPPARSASATLGPSGGKLELAAADGSMLVLEVPAQALAADTVIDVATLPDDGAVARFSVRPAGLLLRAKATLRFTPAGDVPERSVLRWIGNGRSVPLATRRQGGQLVAETAYLGYPSVAQAGAAGGRRVSAAAAPLEEVADAELEVAPLDCNAELAELEFLLRSAADAGDEAEAMAIFERAQAVLLTCTIQRVDAVHRQACDAYDSAALRARTVAADSYAALQSLLAPLLVTQADVQVAGADCGAGSPALEPILEAKFAQFSDFQAAEYARPTFGTDYETARLELRKLYDYLAVCDLMSLTTACRHMRDTLFPVYFDRLREGGYRACRDNGQLQPLAAMYTERLTFSRVLQSERRRPLASAGAYLDLGRFSYEALEADIAHCNSTLNLTGFEDARGVPQQTLSRRMQPGADPGTAPEPVEVELPRNGSLTLAGQVRTLQCPDGSTGIDRLVARVGGVEVGSRGASGGRFMVDTQPFDLIVTDTLAQALLDPATAGRYTVDLFREGDACGGQFSRQFKLYSIVVNVRGGEAVPQLGAGTKWAGTVEHEVVYRDTRSDVPGVGMLGFSPLGSFVSGTYELEQRLLLQVTVDTRTTPASGTLTGTYTEHGSATQINTTQLGPVGTIPECPNVRVTATAVADVAATVTPTSLGRVGYSAGSGFFIESPGYTAAGSGTRVYQYSLAHTEPCDPYWGSGAAPPSILNSAFTLGAPLPAPSVASGLKPTGNALSGTATGTWDLTDPNTPLTLRRTYGSSGTLTVTTTYNLVAVQ